MKKNETNLQKQKSKKLISCKRNMENINNS